jgi:hypothetical protein
MRAWGCSILVWQGKCGRNRIRPRHPCMSDRHPRRACTVSSTALSTHTASTRPHTATPTRGTRFNVRVRPARHTTFWFWPVRDRWLICPCRACRDHTPSVAAYDITRARSEPGHHVFTARPHVSGSFRL